jgi:hypothetical protein
MESTDTISFCKTGTKINTLSAKNVAHKKTGEDLNLCAYDGSSFNPVITINNNHSDCRIMTNLNISGNLNIIGNGIINTSLGIGTTSLNNGFTSSSVHTNSILDINGQTTIRGHILPSQNAAFDLGNAEYKIRHLFLSDNSLWIGDKHKIDVSDGTIKFRKRKTTAIPTSIQTIANGEDINNIQLYIKNKFGHSENPAISDIKLEEWHAYAQSKQSNIKIEEIFKPDIEGDWDENDTTMDKLVIKNNLDVSGNVKISSKLSIGTPYSYSGWTSGVLKYPLYVGDKVYTFSPGAPHDPEANDSFPTYLNLLKLPNIESGTNKAYSLSARFNGRIWVLDALYNSSDSRIKTNIVDVPDNLALEQLRSIPCRYYEYIDKLKRGSNKTIGFIAQEVKSIMPMAVSQEDDFIPNIFKVINCTWTSINGKFSMSSSDLSNVSGIVYKFYVSNATDASDEKEIILTGNSDNTFTCDTQYTNVFCYGNEVDDFNIVDKNKLFTLNFSATQEIDRIQQTHITEIASLKAENQQQQTKIDTLETENQQQQTKINELTSIIDKLKTANSFEEFKQTL